MKVKDLIEARDAHAAYLSGNHAMDATLRQYARTETEFLKFLEERGIPPALDALTADNVELYLLKFRQSSSRGTRTGAAAANRAAILKVWGRFLYRERVLTRVPLRALLLKPGNVVERIDAVDFAPPTRTAAKATELGLAIQRFLMAMTADGRSTASVRTYGGQLDFLLGYACAHGSTQLVDLTPALLRGAMAVRMDGKIEHGANFKGGHAAAHNMAAAAQALVRFCESEGIDVPDLSVVKLPRVPQHVQPRVTAEEFCALEQAVCNRLFSAEGRMPRLTVARNLALLAFLGDTGLRASEVVNMNVGDVNFEEGSIIVRSGKGGNGRALSIVDAEANDGGPTLQALQNYLLHRSEMRNIEEQNALWVSTRAKRLSAQELRRVLAQICLDAGLEGNRPPHAFRRSQFTEQYKADPAAIKVLAARMGWSAKSHHMIDIYTRGAEVDLARTSPRPSTSRRWRDGESAPIVPPAHARRIGPSTGTSTSQGDAQALSAELLRAIQHNPGLVRTLLETLRRGCNSPPSPDDWAA